MSGHRGGGLGAFLAWLVFPAVPVVLENAYTGVLQFSFGSRGNPDPRDWGWFVWLTELGPLLGFAYLAGATLGLPDEPTERRWPRSWLSRRWFWVAVGPWAGFLVWVAIVWVVKEVAALVPDNTPAPVANPAPPPAAWTNTHPWSSAVLFWLAFAFVVATLCYGWLGFAFVAVRRARRLGTARESVRRGLAVSAAFAGSLFGGFWAVTEWWRNYFFDARIVPVLLAAVSLAALCGCGGTITYGEVRRRELFHAVLLAWTFGLALLWRWWARPRSKTPRV